MATIDKRPLKVFLCHASGDKEKVRDLYKRLTAEGVDAWLDQEKLLPGQDWRMEIPRAVREADVVVICLSKNSITKEGYVQKEINFALDIAEEKPEGTIFLIPARLEDCVVPERLNRWQWVDLYDENGFVKLLRSLKLRADAIGATVEPTAYIDSDKELENKLKQLYTEGLAAFYTEDWDKACQRFQSILSEQPAHQSATEKLEEAKQQRVLTRLYEQATIAIRSKDWETSIQHLEELSQKAAGYKDTANLLQNARTEKQLGELYSEAKALHTGQQWKAVVKVFEQIRIIEPNYPDHEDLLPSAEKKVAELKRLAELNDQYSHALHEMATGNWYEARRLLETVHKAEIGFLETENLLKKTENEIAKEEDKRKQNDQINTLYEQAHGLLRSKKWRKALDKVEEILKLDKQFDDTEKIAEQAQKELEREEQEAELQNKLAALYAEAVKLLKEEKYQEALDKWGEVRAIDPKYPDRQRVGRTAKKALTKQVKPISTKPQFIKPKSLWLGLGSIGAIVILVFVINQFGNGGNKAPLAPTTMLTNIQKKTSTPPPTHLPTATLDDTEALYIYDNFSGLESDANINSQLWSIPSLDHLETGKAYLQDGTLILQQSGNDTWLYLMVNDYKDTKITEPMFIEVRIRILPNFDSWAGISFDGTPEYGCCGYGYCAIRGYLNDTDYLHCYARDNRMLTRLIVESGQWHTFRIEIDPTQNEILYFIDGKQVGNDNYIDGMSNIKFSFYLYVWATNNSKQTTGYFDYVRIGPLK